MTDAHTSQVQYWKFQCKEISQLGIEHAFVVFINYLRPTNNRYWGDREAIHSFIYTHTFKAFQYVYLCTFLLVYQKKKKSQWKCCNCRWRPVEQLVLKLIGRMAVSIQGMILETIRVPFVCREKEGELHKWKRNLTWREWILKEPQKLINHNKEVILNVEQRERGTVWLWGISMLENWGKRWMAMWQGRFTRSAIRGFVSYRLL